MNLIDNINKIPNTGKLFIVWQEPKSHGDSGERFVVGEILYNNEFEQINYFDNDDIRRATEHGFRKLDALAGKEGKRLENKEISSALEKRVIARDREDFDSYLKSYMISPSIKDGIDTLTLLANTGRGKNFGDGYSFFPDIQNAVVPFQLTFEVAGHRHSKGMKEIPDKTGMQGKVVTLEIEKDNEFDPYAIKVILDGVMIGYTPKGLSKRLCAFVRDNNIKAVIARVNGTYERPSLIVLLEVL